MANRKSQSNFSALIALLLLVFAVMACGNSQATPSQSYSVSSDNYQSDLERQRKEAIASEKENKRLLLENLRLKQERELKELEDKYKQEISDLKASHSAEIEALMEKQRQEIASLEAAHKNNFEEIILTYESQKAALESRLFYWKVGGIVAAVLAAFFFIACLVIAGRLPEGD